MARTRSRPRPNPASLLTLSSAIRKARVAKGLTAAELAVELGYEKSYFSLLERGLRPLNDQAIVRLAELLDWDPGEALLAAYRERLPEALRHFLPVRPRRGDGEAARQAAREFQAAHLDFEVATSRHHATSDWDGNVEVEHRFEGCRPASIARPVAEVAFRERAILSENAPASGNDRFEVGEAPAGLAIDHETYRADRWLHHRIRFPNGWRRARRAADDTLSFSYRTRHPGALCVDVSAYLKGVAEQGLHHPVLGSFSVFVRNLVDRLEVTLEFPDRYRPQVWEAWSWWGSGGLEATTRNLGPTPCAGLQLRADGNRAQLVVEEPLAGYSFSIVWAPLDVIQYLEARHGDPDGVG